MREYVCVCETHFTLILEIMAWACPVQQDNHSLLHYQYVLYKARFSQGKFHQKNCTQKIK